MHLSAEALGSLPELAQAFLAAFSQSFGGLGTSTRIEGSELWLTIPARAAVAGPLDVMVDDTEITVYLGEHTHTHISPWSVIDERGEPHAAVTTAAIAYLRDVMADEIVMWSQHVDGQQVSGGTFRRSASSSSWPEDVPAYLWSGARYLGSHHHDA